MGFIVILIFVVEIELQKLYLVSIHVMYALSGYISNRRTGTVLPSQM